MTLFKRHGVVLSSGILAAVLLVAGVAQAATFSSEFGVGTQDQDVTNLQTWLTNNGYYSGPITGYYGSLTEAGVGRFQSAEGISATGYVGPLTLAALNSLSGSGTLTGTVSTGANATELAQLESELNSLLAQLQTLEAASTTTPTGSMLSLQASEGVGLSGTLTGSGSAPLTYSITSNPLNGTISSFNSSTGTFVYTPNANYMGNDTFSYTVSNSYGVSAPMTVSVNVQPSSNTAPTGSNISIQGTESVSTNGTLTASGTGPYTYTIVGNPLNGSISSFNSSTGSFTYTPNTNYTGSDSFTYTVGNGSAVSSPSTVTINVQSNSGAPMIPAAPVGQTVSLQTTNGASLNGTLTATGNSPYIYQIITSPTNGTITNFSSTIGSFTYTPTSGYYGSDSFTYEVGNGVATSSPYTVTVTNAI